jgi:prepilin-type N-terminal cleavage/methylation domain-containing protein
MACSKIQSRCGGFSLVELIIAIAILGVGLAMIATTLPSGILNNAESNQYATITSILDNAMPTIRMSLSNTEMSTYLDRGYQTDPFVLFTLPAVPGGIWTYPVYTWPSPSPTDGSNPIRLGNIFVGDNAGLPLGSFAYPVAADPIVAAAPGPSPGYFRVDRPSCPLPVFFYNSDWFPVFNAGNIVGAAPSSRDGWMFAVCPNPLVVAHATGPLPTQAEMFAANDYYFILFPYRKILPTHVCHADFQFIRVYLTSGIVTAYWDQTQNPSVVLVDVNAGVIVPGLANSPLVNMHDPTIPVRRLAQGVAQISGGIIMIG